MQAWYAYMLSSSVNKLEAGYPAGKDTQETE